MPKYRIHSGPVFWDTDRQVATVVVETVQLVLGDFKIFNLLNWELNKVCHYQKN